MYRVFNTLEEAIETWRTEAEKALVKSGILCVCECYRWEDDIKQTSPISRCTLLLPEEIYEEYKQYTKEEDKDYRSKAHVVVTNPGIIRVRYYPNPRDNYSVKIELCERSSNVEFLLKRHLGQKIRLGRNLLVKTSDKNE